MPETQAPHFKAGYKSSKHRALIIPAITPVMTELIVPTSIFYFETYWEIRGGLSYRKVRIGSFAPLFYGYKGYDVVFLNPSEVLTVLNGKVVSISTRKNPADDVKIFDLPSLTKRVCGSEDLGRCLRRVWTESGGFFAVSDYICEGVVTNLTVMRGRIPYDDVCYLYGRVHRVLRKLCPEDLISMSELAGDFKGGGLDPKSLAEAIGEWLIFRSPRWPWANYGLVVDRSRRLITVLNPEVMDYIEMEDIEELRSLNLPMPRPIPILVVKKLTLRSLSRERLEKSFLLLFNPHAKLPWRPTFREELEEAVSRIDEFVLKEKVPSIEWRPTSPRDVQENLEQLFDMVFKALLYSSKRRKKGKDEELPV